MAEIPFHFEDKATDFLIRILSAPAQELFDIRIHAGGRLSRADGAENHHTRVEAPLRNREPRRLRRAPRRRVVMRLAQDERGRWARLRFRVRRQRARARRRPRVDTPRWPAIDNTNDAAMNDVLNHSAAYPCIRARKMTGSRSAISCRNTLSAAGG